MGRTLAFLTLLTAAAACSGPAASRPADGSGMIQLGELAGEDAYQPTYGKADLTRALIADRGAEATGERMVAELDRAGTEDQLRVARADLAVRRRFIASLEACETTGRTCPPRLDEPTWAFDHDADVPVDPRLDAPLRFDLASWRAVSEELFGRACACRTQSCVDSVGVAIDQLEARPTREVQGDEAASLSLTRARECLFRLHGKRPATGATRITDGGR